LIAADKVYNRQTAVTKTKSRRKIEAVAIGPAMGDSIAHRFYEVAVCGPLSLRIKPASYSAHACLSNKPV
jgi:hypothetical protein